MGKRKPGTREMVGVLILLGKSTVADIDESVARRKNPIPRTAWIREAIYEKLEKENLSAKKESE